MAARRELDGLDRWTKHSGGVFRKQIKKEMVKRFDEYVIFFQSLTIS